MKPVLIKLYGTYFNVLIRFSRTKTARLAFKVFSTVRKGRVLPHQKKYLDDAKDQILPLGKHTLQTYRWKGTRQTVLLIHGWESNTWRWHKLIEKLQKANYNIIAFDAPGHGYSSGTTLHIPLYAEAVEQVIQATRPSFLVGHSMGGMSLLYNEYKHPNTAVAKIVTVGSPSKYHDILKHYQHLLGFNDKVMHALKDYFQDRFGISIHQLSSKIFVVENEKKGLLLHDRLDTITPHQASVDVHDHWRNSTLISTEGLGHSMHQDEVNEKIIAFLEV